MPKITIVATLYDSSYTVGRLLAFQVIIKRKGSFAQNGHFWDYFFHSHFRTNSRHVPICIVVRLGPRMTASNDTRPC